MANKVLLLSLLVFIGGLVYFGTKVQPSALKQLCSPSETTFLKEINNKTAQILQDLVKTKYFRLLRVNLQSQCPLPYKNRLYKSKLCEVFRCDQKDIPQHWIKTDKVQTAKDPNVQENERDEIQDKWVWHVEDKQSGKGQYFDVNLNVESFAAYNGTYIWSLVYGENCFKGVNNLDQMCLQEKVFFNIISGLHTSISSHLSRLHKTVSKEPEVADKGDDSFYFNHTIYTARVLSHPERIQNLLFLYQLLLRSLKQMVLPLQDIIISSQNIKEDTQATSLLKNLLSEIKKIEFKPLSQTDAAFLSVDNFHVKQYKKYVYNISSIFNCIKCQKCLLFGKMQTYGLATALKILLGYDRKYKRNELVALFNAVNKISISVNTYFNYKQFLNEGVGAELNKEYHNVDLIATSSYPEELKCFVLWGVGGFVFIIFIGCITKTKKKKQSKEKKE